MKINQKQLVKWIQALDSGRYEQGKHRLQSRKNSYCCLGVGCKVLVPKRVLLYSNTGLMLGSIVPKFKGVPVWLQEIDNDFKKKTGQYLTNLNDGDPQTTFGEIATLLELVYIHKMFEE